MSPDTVSTVIRSVFMSQSLAGLTAYGLALEAVIWWTVTDELLRKLDKEERVPERVPIPFWN